MVKAVAPWHRLTMKSLFHMIVAALVMAAVAGCASSRSTPAPVETIAVGSKPAYIRQKGTLPGDSYQVSRGDTLYSIAWRAGLDFRTLARLNQIKAPYRIYPDQILWLKQKKPKPSKSGKARPVKVPDPTAVAKIKNSSSNVAKTLAHQNQGEYRQSKPAKKNHRYGPCQNQGNGHIQHGEKAASGCKKQ